MESPRLGRGDDDCGWCTVEVSGAAGDDVKNLEGKQRRSHLTLAHNPRCVSSRVKSTQRTDK